MKTLCFSLVCSLSLALPAIAVPAPLAAPQPVLSKPASASPVTVDILSGNQVVSHLVIPAGQAGLSMSVVATRMAESRDAMLLNGNVVLSVLQNGKPLYHIDADEMRISHFQSYNSLSTK